MVAITPEEARPALRHSGRPRFVAVGSAAGLHAAVVVAAALTWPGATPPSPALPRSIAVEFVTVSARQARPAAAPVTTAPAHEARLASAPIPPTKPVVKPAPKRSPPPPPRPSPFAAPATEPVQAVFVPGPSDRQTDPSPVQSAAASPSPEVPRASAAPAAGTPARADAVPAWQNRVLQWLGRFKSYPATAQESHQQGVAVLRFVIGPSGEVLEYGIERSSGSVELDRETLAMIARAKSVPPPPAEAGRDRIEMIVPVQYVLH